MVVQWGSKIVDVWYRVVIWGCNSVQTTVVSTWTPISRWLIWYHVQRGGPAAWRWTNDACCNICSNSWWEIFNHSGERRQVFALTGGPVVTIWCVMLCFTGCSPHGGCKSSGNSKRRAWNSSEDCLSSNDGLGDITSTLYYVVAKIDNLHPVFTLWLLVLQSAPLISTIGYSNTWDICWTHT